MAYQTNKNRNTRQQSRAYVYGNLAPVHEPSFEPVRREEQEPRRAPSRKTRQNRRRESRISGSYVFFLVLASVIAMVICVNFIKIHAEVTASSKNITKMQSQLSELKEMNNSKEGAIMDSINLDQVRDRAINEMGMTYAADNQIVHYANPSGDYIRQVEQIPKEGMLAYAGN